MAYRSNTIHQGSVYLHIATENLFWVKEIVFNNITELKPVWFKIQNMQTGKESLMHPADFRNLILEQKIKYNSWKQPY